ncbi:unnamed protein product [Cyprideis torosa]|uniref:Uncharacterized protein n=1 Tax=Cyprideis torosa TaxID=163714 RepID=A0A7R8WF20_9CRUS|nr:unnamed protein product [Cyprideis torosa]CAG0893596.1 unnamed protein product [Cyprideis torosa]
MYKRWSHQRLKGEAEAGKIRFMNGDKDVAIISEAASSGISLQSDKRVRNQRRRVHITLELPWSADRAIQQFGRTHRSNQANAPEYIFLISDLAGERRFASVVAKRLESLGALTHGDRRATESRDLSRFNIDNKYGRAALESTLKTVMGYEAPVVAPPKDYPGDFFKAVQTALIGVGCIVSDNGIASLEKDATTLPKFMNRILGMPVILQNKLFDYFTDTLGAIVSQAKRSGRYDLGILDLGSHGDKVTRVEKNVYESRHATGKAVTELHKVRVERGMSWQEAQEKYSTLLDDDEGFYVLKDGRNRMNRACAVLAVLRDPASLGKKKSPNAAIIVYRPNTGRQYKTEVLEDLKQKYKKVTPDVAQPLWDEQYKWSEKSCSHAFWLGQCRRMIVGSECDVGLRSKTYHVLSGSVLNVWTEVETVISAYSFNKANRLQVIRMRLDDDTRVIGTIIPNHCVEALKKALTEHVQAKEEEAKLQATPDKIVKSETTSNASEKEADGDGCVVTDMKPGTGVAVKSESKRTRGAAKKILNGGDGDDESDDEEITVFSPFK